MRSDFPRFLLKFPGLAILLLSAGFSAEPSSRPTIRFATFNASLYREQSEQLTKELETGTSTQAQLVAAIVQRCRPDILLINELDYAASGINARLLGEKYFEIPQAGDPACHFSFIYSASVNTGEPSGLDIDGNGKVEGAGDCFGYGTHPGQYGLAVFSRFPIKLQEIRTFQRFLWKDMPQAARPLNPQTGKLFYSDAIWERLRLSSKSHWDVPILIGEKTIHFLVSHPTPPVFDGPEDRNGHRNHDEIRFFADYVDPVRATYHRDDAGRTGGLAQGDSFVIAGDLNADPVDGQSYAHAVDQLLRNPRVHSLPIPKSEGGVEAAVASGGANASQSGDPSHDTGDFADDVVGNLRCDYCLPSLTLNYVQGEVFWPKQLTAEAKLLVASDHRLVWIDVATD